VFLSFISWLLLLLLLLLLSDIYSIHQDQIFHICAPTQLISAATQLAAQS
jgi:hypothetical protein